MTKVSVLPYIYEVSTQRIPTPYPPTLERMTTSSQVEKTIDPTEGRTKETEKNETGVTQR